MVTGITLEQRSESLRASKRLRRAALRPGACWSPEGRFSGFSGEILNLGGTAGFVNQIPPQGLLGAGFLILFANK